jgi:hypothetical protein
VVAADSLRPGPSFLEKHRGGNRAREECLRSISAEPVRRLVHDPAPYHRHQGFDVANANFLHGERVGVQDREVRKLAGLQRALSALVEGQERVVVRRAVPRTSSRRIPKSFFGLVYETDRALRQSPSSFEGADDGTLFAI